MPKDLSMTEYGDVWNVPVTAPEGGDLRRASTVETPLQQLTDRTAYLKSQVDVRGVNRLRYAADYTTASAITDFTEGDFIVIGYDGLYRYIASTTPSPFTGILNMSWFCPVTSGGMLCLVGVNSANYSGTHPVYAPVWTNMSGHLQHPDVVENRIIFDRTFSPDVDDSSGVTNLAIDGTFRSLTHSVLGDVLLSISGAKENDVITFEMSGAIKFIQTGGGAQEENIAEIKAYIFDNLSLPTIPGAITKISSNNTNFFIGFHLIGSYLMTADAAISAFVTPMIKRTSSSPCTVYFAPGTNMRVTCRRP
jgi:hypothetical protein